MIDFELRLCENQTLGAITSTAVDLGTAKPNAGIKPLFVIVCFPTAAGGSGNLTFTVQDSADNSSFAACASTTVAIADIDAPLAIQLPVRHKRYVKVVVSASGTPTGKCSMFIGDAADVPAEGKLIGRDMVAVS